MYKLVSLVILTFLSIPIGVHADIVDPGSKVVKPCITVSNLTDFLDYHLFVTSELVGGMRQLSDGECVETIYKFGTHKLVAVPNGNIQSEWLETSNITGYIQGEKEILYQASPIFSDSLVIPEAKTLAVNSLEKADRVIFEIDIFTDTIEIKSSSIDTPTDVALKLSVFVGLAISIAAFLLTVYVVIKRGKNV